MTEKLFLSSHGNWVIREYLYTMRVISTNIGSETLVIWKGKVVATGIFKKPILSPILLQEEGVARDSIANKKVHGGKFKACYLFSSDYYDFWKEKYPNLTWEWGMFGENLTVESLNEKDIFIGNIYQLGTALIQITQPREPCFKLGIRFNDQSILKEFIEHGHPGTYVQVLKEGIVEAGDALVLKEESKTRLSVKDFYKLLFDKDKNKEHLKLAIEHTVIPLKKREKLKKYL